VALPAAPPTLFCFCSDSIPVALATVGRRWNAPPSGTGTTYPVHIDPSHDCRLCRLDVFDIHDIERVFGIGETLARDLTRDPAFPRPYILSSRCYRWLAVEVLTYRETLRAEAETQPNTEPGTAE
jgi:predicted DNA-binding transcriptional regulator AlpA